MLNSLAQFGRPVFWILVLCAALFALASAHAETSIGSQYIIGAPTPPPVSPLQWPADERAWFRNPDGSCVQCSIGMCGVWQNCPQATTLLWDTSYGPRVRGGSNPSRVEAYCDRRQIPAWSITGSDSTFKWMNWAATTNRYAAIGAGGSHFQTLCYYDPTTKLYWVCNNNSTFKFDPYTPEQFRSLHMASGPWCVILKTPPPPAYPSFEPWWVQR